MNTVCVFQNEGGTLATFQSIERKKPDAHSLGPFSNGKVDVTERLAGRVQAGQRIHGESWELSGQFKYVKLGAVANQWDTRELSYRMVFQSTRPRKYSH